MILLETQRNTSCRVPSSPEAATDKKLSLITNLIQSFLLKIIPVIFFLFALRLGLLHIGDNIGAVFHFKLRAL